MIRLVCELCSSMLLVIVVVFGGLFRKCFIRCCNVFL